MRRHLYCALTMIITLALCLHEPSASTAAETACLQCHGSQTGRGGKPVKPWRSSVHAANGISCHGCHGGDATDAANAMDPARGFRGAPRGVAIPAFCGRCHVGIKGDFLASPHGRALGKGGPTCVTCHGSHEIQKASLALINEKTCTQCHSFERARIIRTAMEQTEHALSQLSRRVSFYQTRGIDVAALDKRLFAQRNRYRSLFHEVDVTKVKGESTRIDDELAALNAGLDRIDQQQTQRKRAGAVVVGFLLLAALLLRLLRKTYL